MGSNGWGIFGHFNWSICRAAVTINRSTDVITSAVPDQLWLPTINGMFL